MTVLQTLRLSLLQVYVRNGMLQTIWWEFHCNKLGKLQVQMGPSEFRDQDVGYEESDKKGENEEDGGFEVHRRSTEANGSPG